MVLGSVSLLGLWSAGALSRRIPPQLALAFSIAMVGTAVLGLIGAANPHRESIVVRVIGGTLGLASLLLGVLLVIGVGI